MFRQLVKPNPPSPVQARQNTESLFVYTPLQISATVETVWRNRGNATTNGVAFIPWPVDYCNSILTDITTIVGFDNTGAQILQQALCPTAGFTTPNNQPGIGDGAAKQYSNWDHLIYAYLIENTRIFDVFAKALELYTFSERLEVPSPASQQFWRNTEYLLFGETTPTMVWTAASRLRRDEIAARSTLYYWMFGIDLSHGAQIASQHPYEKPAASNRDFFPTFELFAREVWRGIMNAKNTSGANTTDPAAIATLARRLYDMLSTRRMNGNLSREEFRAVSVMSWLHLAVMYDSSVVVDLKASASSPEQRLARIGERVGVPVHSRAKALFDLADPFSKLLQGIEQRSFNSSSGAQTLYYPLGSQTQQIAERVIDQYCIATGRDLKSDVSVAAPVQQQQATLPTNGKAKAGRALVLK